MGIAPSVDVLATAGWTADLSLAYRLEGGRTVLRHRHEGPLRVFKSLYPEGPGVCETVIVHPPGGLVGGDHLRVNLAVGEGAHAVIGTPGAMRVYASDHRLARQQVEVSLEAGARLDWCPLETLAYSGCTASFSWRARLAPEAELMGWEVMGLGLPAAGQAFAAGSLRQRLEVVGVWQDECWIRGDDRLLLDSPVGLAGRPVVGTFWLATGTPLVPARRERLQEALRAALPPPAGRNTLLDPDQVMVGTGSPCSQILLVRVLGPTAQAVMVQLQQAWAVLRVEAWSIAPQAPRVWSV